MRPFIRLKTEGLENIPSSGAVIICSNHISYFDPIALGLCVRRKMSFMAKSELFSKHGAIVSAFLRSCGAFPVRRGTFDSDSLGYAQTILENGGVVGIFPQGGIVRPDKPFSPKPGAALLAARSSSVVIPSIICTRGKIRPFSTITVKFGKPLIPPANQGLTAAKLFNDEIRKAVSSLFM